MEHYFWKVGWVGLIKKQKPLLVTNFSTMTSSLGAQGSFKIESELGQLLGLR